jgi:transglutaminase-like putative cysteine protease
VKALAKEAVGSEKDAWKKAQRIERWVHERMGHDNSAPFAPADQIAANPKGDCRHHALLAAAMCRAAGVPSQTAVGLVYAYPDDRTGPVLAFHMWYEVWVDGQWVALDAIFGKGSVGADHIKIADSSWADVHSLTPMLPVARVLGKVSVEVTDVKYGR